MYPYKLDITERNGVSDELKNGMIVLFKKYDYHFLVEEGGEGTKEHYHLHGILKCNYKHTYNFRIKVLKPIFKRLGKELTPWGVKIKTIKELGGALSYIYKNKRVLSQSNVMVEQIRPWINKPVDMATDRLLIGKHNYVRTVLTYMNKRGINPTCWLDVRNVMNDMARENYCFKSGPWVKCVVGQLMQYYNDPRFMLSTWDMSCNQFV